MREITGLIGGVVYVFLFLTVVIQKEIKALRLLNKMIDNS